MTLLLFASTVLIWGSTWIAIAFQIGPVPVLVSVFYRFALAALMLLPVLALMRKLAPTTRRDHLFILAQGLCLFSFNFICFYNASRSIPSGLISVVFSLATLYNAVNARLFFGEKLSGRLAIASLIGFCGIVLLFSREIFAGGFDARSLTGLGLAALGTLFFSLGNMASRRNSAAGVPPLTANAYGMAYGSLVLLMLIWLTNTPIVLPPDAKYTWALLYLALFGSVIGFTTYLMLVARIGSGRAAYTTVMFPVIALVLSNLFEGWQWHWGAIVGIALTICGNIILFARK